jgi:Ca2+-binding RTX toxin-like protein
MLVVGPASAAPSCGGRAATIVGTRRADRLVGTPGRDVIVGLGGNDRILGAIGNDVLCGGRGSDLLVGGRGDDILRGGLDELRKGREFYTVGDRLRGGQGADQYRGGVDRRPVDYRIPDRITLARATRGIVFNAPAGVVTGEGKDIVSHQSWGVSGSRFDDYMIGGLGDDFLDGRRGDDHLVGGKGADVLIDDAQRGAGDDTLEGGAGRDSLAAGRGSDLLRGGPGNDDLNSYQPTPDQLFGGGGDDSLYDFLVGSPLEHLDGGAGFNDLSVELPVTQNGEIPDYKGTVDMTTGAASLTVNDHVAGFVLANANRLSLAHGRWTVIGTDRHDEILAWGNARLYAYASGGDDSVQGGRRNDNLSGGPGEDDVWPGKGVDTCVDFEVQHEPCELP